MKFLIPGRLDKVEFGKEKAKEHRKKKADGLGFQIYLNWKQDQDIYEQTKQFLEKKTAQSMGSNLNRIAYTYIDSEVSMVGAC